MAWQKDMYATYRDMIRRCYDKSRASFKFYGGRGIAVCERWRVGIPRGQGFRNFVSDMGKKPKNTTLDRIDNNGAYSPENCRWATFPQQHTNRRSNVFITFNGETMTATEWGKRSGLRCDVITRRIKNGIPLDVALFEKHIGYENQKQNIKKAIDLAAEKRRARTHCKRGHPLSGDNLYVGANGYRTCRTCKREAMRGYREQT